jgi:hypothetical protein
MQRKSVCVLTLALAVLSGCGRGSDPYPQARVTTAIGQAGMCEACGKAIAIVAEGQYRTFGPSRFVVCDDQCEKVLAERLKKQ